MKIKATPTVCFRKIRKWPFTHHTNLWLLNCVLKREKQTGAITPDNHQLNLH